MELLYVWINKSENGVFEEHGINLSPEYNFLVNRLDNGVVLSEDASWHKTESIFKSDTIVNVTAVVGKNGAGKTTLLKFLYNMHNQIGGMRAGSERNPFLDKNQMIVIAKINEVPMVFYNICNENFTNTTQYHTSINLKENIFESSFTYYEEVKSFYDVFRLFFTNSNYSIDKKSFIGVQGELSQLSLSDSEMYSISSSFFRKVLDLNHSIDFFSPGWYLNWRNDYLYREYALLDFQKICDIIYYFKLLNEGSFENYNGPRNLDHGIEKMREHGIMRLSKGRSANYVIQNVHVGIQSKGSHRGSPRGEKPQRDFLSVQPQSQHGPELEVRVS